MIFDLFLDKGKKKKKNQEDGQRNQQQPPQDSQPRRADSEGKKSKKKKDKFQKGAQQDRVDRNVLSTQATSALDHYESNGYIANLSDNTGNSSEGTAYGTFAANQNFNPKARQEQQQQPVRRNRNKSQSSGQNQAPQKNDQKLQKKQKKKQKQKSDPNILEITFEDDEEIEISSSEEEESDDELRGCYVCKPHIYSPNFDAADPYSFQPEEESYIDHHQQYIELLRKKCKAELKKTKNKRQKMKLDDDLRMSYRHNNHQFHNKLGRKQQHQSEDIDVQYCYKMCRSCQRKMEKREMIEKFKRENKEQMRIDKTKFIYDQEEIDHINDHQSKIYISHVEVNPFLKFGIRAHYEQLTIAHCMHSMFNIFHKDFLLMWVHFIPGLYMLWQLIALQMGISHFYTDSTPLTFGIQSVALGLLVAWLFTKTIYYMFYVISYRVEHELNKWVKIANMTVIFIYSIFLSYALFNHFDQKQYELGYLTIFIMTTLLILNVILTLNPIHRDEGTDQYSRSCCSSNNLMMTISFIFCFKVMEIHHFFAATEEQKTLIYKPFHQIIAFWLFGLWINIQNLPERFFPDSKIIQKYFSSDVLKSVIVVISIIVLNFLLRDAMHLAEVQRQKMLHPQGLTPAPIVQAPVVNTIVPQATAAPVIQNNPAVDKELSQSKKQLQEAEEQLMRLKKALTEKNEAKVAPPSPAVAVVQKPDDAPKPLSEEEQKRRFKEKMDKQYEAAQAQSAKFDKFSKFDPVYDQSFKDQDQEKSQTQNQDQNEILQDAVPISQKAETAAPTPVVEKVQEVQKPVEEVKQERVSEAAADSPYNQPNVQSTAEVATEAKKSWAQQVYLYLVQ